MLLYGPSSVGKTFLVKSLLRRTFEKRDYYVHYFDCNALSAQVTTADSIDTALEYFLQHYLACQRLQPAVMILDNLNALCPSVSSDDQQQMPIVDHLKSLKFTTLLSKLVENPSAGVHLLGIVRHYMQSLNMKLMDVGAFDTMVEMQAPAKETRYAIIRDVIVQEEMRTKELQLQRLAQMTEYFMAKDIVEIAKQVIDSPHTEKEIEDKIVSYKA